MLIRESGNGESGIEAAAFDFGSSGASLTSGEQDNRAMYRRDDWSGNELSVIDSPFPIPDSRLWLTLNPDAR